MKRIQEKVHNLLPYIVITGLWLIFCFPYFIKGLAPFPSNYLVSFFPPWNAAYAMPVKNNAMPDIITQIYPWKMLTIDTWKKGEIPLWNPYSFSGSVHAGNYQSAVFSPLNSLFFILPFIDAWSLLILLQPLLAGLFMVIFLREIGSTPTASTVAGIGFMFCGFMVTWMAYGTLGYAALFLPLILWSVEKYMKNESWVPLLVGSFGTTASFFSGHFQISVYIWLVSLLYICFRAYSQKKWKKGIVLLITIIIGLCLAAPQLLLTFDAFNASVRASNTQLKEVIPWQYIITFFSPDFYGNPVTRNDWFGHYAEWAGYIGIVPFLFAQYALFYSSSKKKIFFSLLLLFSLLFAYLSPLSMALFAWKIPVLSTSAASRVIVIASFSLCVLGAFGFDQLIDDWKNIEWKKRKYFGIGVCFLLGLIWVMVYGILPIQPDRLGIAKRNLILPSLFLCVTVATIYLGFIKHLKNKTIYLVVFLICISMFDSYRYATKWMPFESKEFIFPQVNAVTFIQKEIGYGRVFGNIGNEVGSYFKIPLIEGYDAMYQGRYGEFIHASSKGILSEPGRSVVQFDKHGLFSMQVLQLLGVKYVLHKFADGRNAWVFPHWNYPEQFISRFKDEHYEVFEYKDAFPRVFLGSKYIVKTEKQDSINTLFSKDFDRRNTIILEKTPEFDPQDGDGSVEVVHASANRLVLNVKTSNPKILFRSEVFDEGWNVTVDKEHSILYRADYNFQAVMIPEGIHIVEFYYWPKSLTVGLILSGVALGILTFYIIIQTFKKKTL